MKKLVKKTNVREFTVLIEQDEDGYYVANVPAIRRLGPSRHSPRASGK
jgi:hypothetical protein